MMRKSIWIWKQFCVLKENSFDFPTLLRLLYHHNRNIFVFYTQAEQICHSNLHINKIFSSLYIPSTFFFLKDLIFMNWHTQLLFTSKIIIKQSSPCIQKRPGNTFLILHGVYPWIVCCVYNILHFNIQHISFKIHQVIGFYFEYQSYVRNLHFFVQIFMLYISKPYTDFAIHNKYSFGKSITP